MAQANVSRARAVRALRDNQSDIVNAIMVSGRPSSAPCCWPCRAPPQPALLVSSLCRSSPCSQERPDRTASSLPPAPLLNKQVSPHGLYSGSSVLGACSGQTGFVDGRGAETLPASVRADSPRGWRSGPPWGVWPSGGPRDWESSPHHVPRGWDPSSDSRWWWWVPPPPPPLCPRCPPYPEMVSRHPAVAQAWAWGLGLGRNSPDSQAGQVYQGKPVPGWGEGQQPVLGPPGTQLCSGRPCSPCSLFSKVQ